MTCESCKKLQDALGVERAANKRIQERLDTFERTGKGYKCRCDEYERIIAELDRELKLCREEKQ